MILDEYTLIKSLGKGAFGEVFLTTKKGSNELYATKQLNKDIFDNRNTKKYFLNEINILKELSHPNIVKFADLKRTANHFYIMMEYCNGGELCKTLEAHISKTGRPFSEEVVQSLMKQIISAFQYIHGKDIIHRDIKLENILLNYNTNEDKENKNVIKATVKIIDFGFAARMEKTGLKYTTLGSPINMDPLILSELRKRGKNINRVGYDQKADIWSLGTICYELAIGKSAFEANKIDDLIAKIEKGEYTVPTNLSRELISFINGMLQYDPNQRLNIDQLAKHPFLKKNVSDFEKLDLRRVKTNKDKNEVKLNVKTNQSIWAMFNEEDELLKIKEPNFGNDIPLKEKNSKEIKDNNNNNFNNNIKNILNINNYPNQKNQNGNNIPNQNNLENKNNNINNKINNNIPNQNNLQNKNNNINNKTNNNNIPIQNNLQNMNNNINNKINNNNIPIQNNLQNKNNNINNLNNKNNLPNQNNNFQNVLNNQFNANKNVINQNNNYLNQKTGVQNMLNNPYTRVNAQNNINNNLNKIGINPYFKNNIQTQQQYINPYTQPNIQNPLINRGSNPNQNLVYVYNANTYQTSTGYPGINNNPGRVIQPIANYQQIQPTPGYVRQINGYPYGYGTYK